MPEIVRNRDVIIFDKGASFTVNIDNATAVSGWRGGQIFQYTQPVGDELRVKISDGGYCGFALWGSDEISDKYNAMTGNQPAYKFIVLGAGGWIISTISYEKYTYASRTGGGPLVPIVYKASDRLVPSLKGNWTVENEWLLSGDPRGSNDYFIGYLCQLPTPERNGYMGIQVSI